MLITHETQEIISRLNKSYIHKINRHDCKDYQECLSFQALRGMKGYEVWFLPEVLNYESCYDRLSPDDVVFDVGAGDLRFDLIMAEKVKRVYAVEINPNVLYRALRIINYDMPENLIAICGNAFEIEPPNDVTVITCLMIHRKHPFPESWHKHKIISYEFKKEEEVKC